MRPIDADALADYLDDELLNECFGGQEISAEDAVRMALRKVLDAPTLDVAPVVHARWVRPIPGDGEPFCSACKCGQPLTAGYEYLFSRCCSNCGAKMDAEAQNDPQTV